MTSIRVTHVLLSLIALALTAIAIEPLFKPTAVDAQTAASDPFYFEPGVYLLRIPNAGGQVLGKVVVTLRTGGIWGFPTTNSDH